jgi:hypothetical protein
LYILCMPLETSIYRAPCMVNSCSPLQFNQRHVKAKIVNLGGSG